MRRLCFRAKSPSHCPVERDVARAGPQAIPKEFDFMFEVAKSFRGKQPDYAMPPARWMLRGARGGRPRLCRHGILGRRPHAGLLAFYPFDRPTEAWKSRIICRFQFDNRIVDAPMQPSHPHASHSIPSPPALADGVGHQGGFFPRNVRQEQYLPSFT